MRYQDEELLSESSEQKYRAFLLRCWPEKANGGSTWRFSLVHVENSQTKVGFNSLEELVYYLQNVLK